jgi:hypothetical protein
MNSSEMVSVALLGMAAIAGISLFIYASLPRAVMSFAAEHGRYKDLGNRDEVINHTSGNTPVAGLGSLQGQSV